MTEIFVRTVDVGQRLQIAEHEDLCEYVERHLRQRLQSSTTFLPRGALRGFRDLHLCIVMRDLDALAHPYNRYERELYLSQW